MRNLSFVLSHQITSPGSTGYPALKYWLLNIHPRWLPDFFHPHIVGNYLILGQQDSTQESWRVAILWIHYINHLTGRCLYNMHLQLRSHKQWEYIFPKVWKWTYRTKKNTNGTRHNHLNLLPIELKGLIRVVTPFETSRGPSRWFVCSLKIFWFFRLAPVQCAAFFWSPNLVLASCLSMALQSSRRGWRLCPQILENVGNMDSKTRARDPVMSRVKELHL